MAHLAESTRRLSHKLHPAVLEHSGLAAALRGYCSELSSLTELHVALEIDGCLAGLTPEVSLCIYRVVQEGLQNVVRHAGVREARVHLERSESALRLKISDRGAGIEVNRRPASTGLGLISIKERVRLLHAKFDLESRPNEGTVLTIKVPVA